MRRVELPAIGWREWVALPRLGVPTIKVKVDSGARSSALHAFDVEEYRHRGAPWVRFAVHPLQRNGQATVYCEAALDEYRTVRSSGGHETRRPVIVTEVELMNLRWSIELTLASRDAMGFRMLLGRQAVRNRFLVDTGHSFLAGRPSKKVMAELRRLGRERPKKRHS